MGFTLEQLSNNHTVGFRKYSVFHGNNNDNNSNDSVMIKSK